MEQRQLHNQYLQDLLKMFETKSSEALTVLNQQEYAQEMMEGLINDMLDQAKIDNNAFKINKEYFNLPMVVYKALNIIKA